ncbi:LAME_0C06238g1_1 [Lachancea meyersii CBS 8951]|uniref:Ubiquitin carboxyl-terminal hydrolase n=1 Tax=Lachancea meyersii CBS 8951 TaxID=1266667 RepID=A0A1G4J219_9SACH|nr:LAME_0C06238g1_1 [Lachancea meyersii CBS 8951]
MSGNMPKDNQDRSYSMYPPTSPAVPPASMQYQMGVYGNPNNFAQYGYGYPMPMDMYASQGAPFMGYGMNPNMMYFGGANSGSAAAAVPPPTGQKRKYYANKNEVGNKNSENQYYGNGSGNSNSKVGSATGTAAAGHFSANGASKSVPITIKNQYKFELGNSNSVSTAGLKLKYPFFANTDAESFRHAQDARAQITLDAISHKLGPRLQSSFPDMENGMSVEDGIEVEADGNVDVDANADADIDTDNVQDITDQFQTAPATAPSFQPEVQSTPKTQPASEVKEETIQPTEIPAVAAPSKSVKSWSAVALGAVGSSGSSKVATASTTDKKDKKYIPPTIKSLEPVGVVAIRVCFDPEYVKYTTENLKGSGMALQTVAPRGIVNSGNICFMSSILQALLFCQPFVGLMNLMSVKTPAKMGPTGLSLLDACLELYRKFDRQTLEREKAARADSGVTGISSPLADAINPEDFYKALSKLPKFKDLRWGHQEDAEEFLTHLLDQLHEEFVHSICMLSESDISNLIRSINDENSKVVLIRNLATYKNAEFIKHPSNELKSLLDKFGIAPDDLEEDQEKGWQEVSSTSKKGKKTKTAAKRTVIVEPSPISVLFGGQFRSVLDVPQNKEPQSITLDPFQTIQLDISDPSVDDLESAFRKFSESEQIPFKTSTGNSVEAKKQTFIDKLPQVLLIQLKRFSFINNTDKSKIVNYNAYSGRVEKIRRKILYRHELTIPSESISSVNSNFHKQNGSSYKLIGVVYHHGVSPSGGHYTCDVFDGNLSKWYRIDDISLQEVDKEDILKGGEEGNDSRTAYILLYQRV